MRDRKQPASQQEIQLGSRRESRQESQPGNRLENQSGSRRDSQPGSHQEIQPGSQPESRQKKQQGSASRGRARRWKTALEYALGAAVLVAVLALAFTLPGLYTSWQDEQLLSAVTTDSRESISFIDTSSLDIAGRMQMLSQVTEVTDAESILNYEEGSSEITEQYEICVEKLTQWVECGIFPEFALEMATEENLANGWCEFGYVNTDQGMFSVYSLAFYSVEYYKTDDQTLEWMYGYLYIIMDAETDMIYAAELTNDNGVKLMDCLAGYIGYDSYEDAVEQIWEAYQDGTLEARQEDYSTYDFASVCGATSEEIHGEPGMLSLDVDLEYDTFTGRAYRRISYDGSLLVMFGSMCWIQDVWEAQSMQTAADVFDVWDGSVYPVSKREELDLFLYQCEDAWLQAALVEEGVIAIEETEVETERYDAAAEEAGIIAVEEAEAENEGYDTAVMDGNVAIAGDYVETEIETEAIGQ